MSSNNPQTGQQLEAPEDTHSASKDTPSKAVNEAVDSADKLADDFKKLIKSLKDGASSGVTGIIGKPVLIDGTSKDGMPVRIFRSGEIPKIKIGLKSPEPSENERPPKGSDAPPSSVNFPQKDVSDQRPGEQQQQKTSDGSAKGSDGPAATGGDGSAKGSDGPAAKGGDGSAKGSDGPAAKGGDGSAKGSDGPAAKGGDGSAKGSDGPAAKGSDGPAAKDTSTPNGSDGQAKVSDTPPSAVNFPQKSAEAHPTDATNAGAVPQAAGDAQQSTERADQPRAAGRGHVVQMEAETIRANPDAAYRGEVINRDVAPGNHTVARGETLTTVARDHLGPGASEEDVQKHVRELERVNHLQHNQRLREGQELTLPGHTTDGGYVTKDSAGRTHTRWQDNTERVESTDGSGYTHRYNEADGSYTEHHWGHSPAQNYELTKTSDGRYLVADRPGETPHEPTDANDVRVAHARMNDVMESKVTDPAERARFQASMDAFEQRARERNMPPDEVAKTYQQLETLLQHEGNRPTTEAQRRILAEQIMDNAAHPNRIDQGDHSTCNVTTVESRLYTRNPSEAARLVTEVATTGHFTAHDGTVVRYPAGSLRPDHQAVHQPPNDGERSYASQVFQVTALNMYYQTEPYTYTDARGRQHTVPPGGMSYEQHRQRPGYPDDAGERLIDTTTHPPTTIRRSPDITDDGIVRVNNRLTGETRNDVVVSHSGDCYGDPTRVATISNESQLNDRIAQAAHDGQLPIIVRVETDNQPWLRDSGNGSAGGSGGAHVISITGYEAGPPARVQVDNQWGSESDYEGRRTLSVHDLYLSMRPAENKAQIAELQRDVTWDRDHHTEDTRKEFELLRLKHNLPATDPDHLTDAQFEQQMNAQIDAAGRRWADQRAHGTFNENEYNNGIQTLGEIMATQPPDVRLRMMGRTHTDGLVPDERYDRALARTIHANNERWAQEDRMGTGNAAERRRAREELDRQLNAMTPERKQAILNNSR